jgi:hypothetical protein
MTTGKPHTASWPGATAPGWTAGQETYEQLLALADQIGAACSEAFQRLNTAYAQAYQNLVGQAGVLPGKFSDAKQSEMLNALMDPSSLAGRFDDVQESALAIGDDVAEMGVDIGLAALSAFEQAALAVAKFQEQVGAASQVDVVRTTSETAAELIRKITQAGASTVRDMAS